jgi:hypothetical protein
MSGHCIKVLQPALHKKMLAILTSKDSKLLKKSQNK